jgi:hypothetical protein
MQADRSRFEMVPAQPDPVIFRLMLAVDDSAPNCRQTWSMRNTPPEKGAIESR